MGMREKMYQKLVAQGMPEEQARGILQHDRAKSFKKFLGLSAGLATGALLLPALGAGGAASATAAAASSAPSTLGKIGGFLKGHGGDILKYGEAAGNAYGAYKGAQNSDRYRRIQEAEFAKRAPLRDRSQQMLLDDSLPDTSATFADPYAPTGRYRRVNVGSRGGY